MYGLLFFKIIFEHEVNMADGFSVWKMSMRFDEGFKDGEKSG